MSDRPREGMGRGRIMTRGLVGRMEDMAIGSSNGARSGAGSSSSGAGPSDKKVTGQGSAMEASPKPSSSKSGDFKKVRQDGAKGASPKPSASGTKKAASKKFQPLVPYVTPMERMEQTLETHKCDIKQFKFIPQDTVVQWAVKRVVTPDEFYLEFKFDEKIVGSALAETNYDKWWPKMQAFYNDAQNQAALKLGPLDFSIGRCYALQVPDPGDDNDNRVAWHRVRVHRICSAQGMKALVFFCDIGKLATAERSHLFKLTPEFARFAAHLFRCYLYQVRPKIGGLRWDAEAIDYFTDMVTGLGGQSLSGIVLARSGTQAHPLLPDVFHNLGVVLFGKPSCTVNALMVKSGNAIGVGLFASCPHQICQPRGWEGRNFARVGMGTPQTLPKVEPKTTTNSTENPTKSTGFKNYGEEYKKAVELYAASTRPEITWYPPEYKLKLQRQQQGGWLPASVTEKIGSVKITGAEGPSHIILHLTKYSQVLADMQDEIGRKLKEAEPLKQVLPGMFVAIPNEYCSSEGNRITTWYRSMIIERLAGDGRESFKVIAVDHGHKSEVDKRQLFRLDEEFLEIPSFAIRAHLAVPGLFPFDRQRGWTNKAKINFVKYLLAEKNSSPRYYAYIPPQSEVIQLESMDQEIVFNWKVKKWVAEKLPLRNDDKLSSLPLKKDPLLESLLKSVGVVMKYEVNSFDSPFWKFDDLHGKLLENGDGVMKTKARSDKRIHVDIIDELEDKYLQTCLEFYHDDDE